MLEIRPAWVVNCAAFTRVDAAEDHNVSAGVATGVGADDPPNPPPRPPAPRPALTRSISACAPHRMWIEAQVALGRNAGSIYQDLVEGHGFAHQYNSVKRFVGRLKTRTPARFNVLEFLPGEAQVDYGLGSATKQHWC